MSSTSRTSSPRTLDDLAQLDPDELMAMYRNARTPKLADLDGKLSGRMLAVPRIQKPAVKKWLETFSRSSLFPWQGKTFMHETSGHGHGGNRLVGEGVTWFKFETSIGPSDAAGTRRAPRIAPPPPRRLPADPRLQGSGPGLGSGRPEEARMEEGPWRGHPDGSLLFVHITRWASGRCLRAEPPGSGGSLRRPERLLTPPCRYRTFGAKRTHQVAKMRLFGTKRLQSGMPQ